MMKQKISLKQLLALPTEKYHNLIQWEFDRGYIKPNKDGQAKVKQLTIGQMIELLYMNGTVTIESEDYEGPLMGWIVDKKIYGC